MDAQLVRELRFKYSDSHLLTIPVVAANMDTIGTMDMAAALQQLGMTTALHKTNRQQTPFDVRGSVWHTVGTKEFDDEIDKLHQQYDVSLYRDRLNPFMICVDVANGYADGIVKHVYNLRAKFPSAVIMAGNVCTPELTYDIIATGCADVVKIGIGPGKVCRTRMVTGVGYPQLSAIMECADCAHGLKAHVCADGGIREYGDIAKAFGAGADLVMLGTMLGGHDECAGEWQHVDDGIYTHDEAGCMIKAPPPKKAHKIYGMASDIAQQKYGTRKRTPEGTDIWVPYKGSVKNTAEEIMGALRSTCSYIGASCVKDIPKCCTFIKVNRIHG
jgi:GMP reductase